jgi:hypothetical protein
MNERLRNALDSEPVPRDLEAKVRARLDVHASSPWPRLLPGLALMAFMLVFVAFNGVSQTHELLRVGIRDHVHCAIGGVYPKQTERAAMVQAMGPYSVMLQPILDQTPGDQVVSAHRCTAYDRAYMHVIVRHEGKLISVIMTKREKGESFPRLFSAGLYSGTASIRDGELDGYTVSGFTAGGYFGYVVSSMPMERNRDLAARLAPVVRRYTGA